MYRLFSYSLLANFVIYMVVVPGALAACDAITWRSYRNTQLWKIPNSQAYFYVVSQMAIDADGAPNAYHPQDKGIDFLANAGYPNGGWKSVLVPDPQNPSKPFVQPSGEFKGYFISQTTLQDRSLPVTDIRRYVNSTKVPYMVFPGTFWKIQGTGGFGDVAAVLNLDNNRESPAIIADAGPQNASLGEVSIRLAENLGGRNVNPRNGAGIPQGRFVYAVFPKTKSSPSWPLSNEKLQTRMNDLLSSIGGWKRIRSCLTNR